MLSSTESQKGDCLHCIHTHIHFQINWNESSFDILALISQLIKSKKLEGERKEEQHEQGTEGIMGNMKQKIDAASDAIKQKFTGARESADEEYGSFLLFFSDTFSVVDFLFHF